MAAYTYDYGLGLGAPIQSDKFRITSWVGPRARFATSGGQHSSTSHAGVDIATPVGTNLLAPMTGKVIHVVKLVSWFDTLPPYTAYGFFASYVPSVRDSSVNICCT